MLNVTEKIIELEDCKPKGKIFIAIDKNEQLDKCSTERYRAGYCSN